MKNQLTFLVLFICFMSCSAPTKEVCIDNPTDSDIQVQFDDDEPLHIKANEKKLVTIKFGKRTLHFNDTLTEIVLDGEREYIINPTKSLYYIQNIPYVVSRKGQENYNNDYGVPKSFVNGFQVNGDFEEIKDKVLITKNWTFGLDEDANESVNIQTDPVVGYYIVRKIHRGTDLSAEVTQSLIDQLEETLLSK